METFISQPTDEIIPSESSVLRREIEEKLKDMDKKNEERWAELEERAVKIAKKTSEETARNTFEKLVKEILYGSKNS